MRLQLAKVAFIFGVAGGILCALFALTIYWTDTAKLLVARSSDFWISAVCIGFGLFYIRHNRQNGELLFSEGIMVASMLNLILSVVSASITWLYIQIDAEWLNAYIHQSIAYVEMYKDFTLEKYGEQGYQQQVKDVNSITAGSVWLDEFLRKLFVSFILCPVMALVLRKKAKKIAE